MSNVYQDIFSMGKPQVKAIYNEAIKVFATDTDNDNRLIDWLWDDKLDAYFSDEKINEFVANFDSWNDEYFWEQGGWGYNNPDKVYGFDEEPALKFLETEAPDEEWLEASREEIPATDTYMIRAWSAEQRETTRDIVEEEAWSEARSQLRSAIENKSAHNNYDVTDDDYISMIDMEQFKAGYEVTDDDREAFSEQLESQYGEFNEYWQQAKKSLGIT